MPRFDLIICDEAHRTTGVTLAGQDESAFVRVHDDAYIGGDRRLYMTATPRVYSEDSKSEAKNADALLASMDDRACTGRSFIAWVLARRWSRDYSPTTRSSSSPWTRAWWPRPFRRASLAADRS
ncbi:DEAD/DEAH box helicase family protein [Thermobispora bispora]|uniref:DEAD/DEAH box helicase family protein n=1 Tax=Thermobispora bispora TaxID=2006 RepID=UPI0024780DCF|nr:DEAD/DEAH box helicase family protein [Thermobispora bispora]